MNRVEKRLHSLHERVSRAYYDYGRLASAHPYSILSFCILSMVVLSYPALSRVKLPQSSPMEVYWTDQNELSLNESGAPEWLLLEPSLYFQQIVVTAIVDPWDGISLKAPMSVKGPLSRAFSVVEHLERIVGAPSGASMDSLCFRVHTQPVSTLLPAHSCLLLSPSLFWANDRTRFERDADILGTIFGPPCTNAMCPRDILFGEPTRFTGVKPVFQTNRHRSIEFAVTFVQSRFDRDYRNALLESLRTEFSLEQSLASDDYTFVHVFYRPRKYFTDYFPLLASHFLCMIYFYYTVSKFEMVKSRWGLAFVAFNTVFWTLAMTSGICAYFDLTPTLWGAGLYPYLAMVIGLENVLCITRAVVYTPPTMGVPARLAHGLSHEGYNLTKFFLCEMTFLAVAWLTFVDEIQEFCTFAFIALVVDFYMQLFFYTPCLFFDLQRLGEEEKQRFSLLLFQSDAKKLKNFPEPKCPARIFLPWLFEHRKPMRRTLSDAKLNSSSAAASGNGPRNVRRTRSTDKVALLAHRDSPISYRLRLLYFWTRTRFVQRIVMGFFVVWVVWVAFVVHKLRLWESREFLTNTSAPPVTGFGISHHILDTAPLQWVRWQRQTFKWWPAVFAEYNMSLSGHYVTFLPPIVLNTVVSVDDPSLQPVPEETTDQPSVPPVDDATKTPELQNRIHFLERQMTTLLLTSMFLPFSIVVGFILYVCFWDRWQQYRSRFQTKPRSEMATNNSLIIPAPTLFSSPETVVECVAVQRPSTVVLTTLDSRVYVLDTHNANGRQQIARWRPTDSVSPPSRSSDGDNGVRRRLVSECVGVKKGSTAPAATMENVRAQIWSLALKQNIVVLGCSDGSLEIGNVRLGRILTRHSDVTNSGVVQVRIRANRVIAAHLNGTLELLELLFSEMPTPLRCNALVRVKPHQKPVSVLESAGLYLFSAGQDSLIKVFDVRTLRHLHTLAQDDSAVLELKVDEQIDSPLILYSRHASGLICAWDVESGERLRTLTELVTEGVACPRAQLAISCNYFVVFTELGELLLWDKKSHDFLLRLLASDTGPCGVSHVLALSDSLVVTALGNRVQFWDLVMKAVIRYCHLPQPVDSLTAVGEWLLCIAGGTVYRVGFPSPTARTQCANASLVRTNGVSTASVATHSSFR